MAFQASTSSDISQDILTQVIFSPYNDTLKVNISVNNHTKPGLYLQYIKMQNNQIFDSVNYYIKVIPETCYEWKKTDSLFDSLNKSYRFGKDGKLFAYNKTKDLFEVYNDNNLWKDLISPPLQNLKFWILDNNDNPVAFFDDFISRYNNSNWEFFAKPNNLNSRNLFFDAQNRLRTFIDDNLWNIYENSYVTMGNDYDRHIGGWKGDTGLIWVTSSNILGDSIKLSAFEDDNLAYSEIIFPLGKNSNYYFTRMSNISLIGDYLWSLISAEDQVELDEHHYIARYSFSNRKHELWKLTDNAEDREYLVVENNELISKEITNGLIHYDSDIIMDKKMEFVKIGSQNISVYE